MRRSLLLAVLILSAAAAGCGYFTKRSIQERIERIDMSEGLSAESTLKGFVISHHIDASPEDVFAFCRRTSNLRYFFSGRGGGQFDDDPDVLSQLGDNFEFVFGDIPVFPSFKGRMVVTRIIEDQSLQLFFVGPIWCRIEMYVEPEGKGTRITFRNMYQLLDFFVEQVGEERSGEFVEAVAGIWKRRIQRLPDRMDIEESYAEAEVKFFEVLCNTHRAEVVVDIPPDRLWERAIRKQFISGILGSSAEVKGGDDAMDMRGQTLDLLIPADAPVMEAQAVVVNAIPAERVHLTLFMDDITGGAIARLMPDDGGSRLVLLFYYEIPSDDPMPPELFMIFASARQEVEKLLSNLSSAMEG
jgi:hypothetical protein